MICRYYLMTSKDGHGDDLGTALVALAAKVKPMDGCRGVDIYRDARDANRFHFLEHWASRDAHKAAGAALGQEAFAPVMAHLAEPPAASYIEPVAA